MDEPYTSRPATNAEAVRALVFAIPIKHGLAPAPESTDSDLADLEAS